MYKLRTQIVQEVCGQWKKKKKKRITNTVHILTSGKVLFHLLYADNNKQTTRCSLHRIYTEWDLKTEFWQYGKYFMEPDLLSIWASTWSLATFFAACFSVCYSQCRYILGSIYTTTMKLVLFQQKQYALKHFPQTCRVCALFRDEKICIGKAFVFG